MTRNKFHFPPFCLDLTQRQLLQSGVPVKRKGKLKELGPMPFAVLQYLVEHAGKRRKVAEIKEMVWGKKRVVSDETVRWAIREIRVFLDDDAAEPKFIKTVPGHEDLGYLFKEEALRSAWSEEEEDVPAVRVNTLVEPKEAIAVVGQIKEETKQSRGRSPKRSGS